MATNSAIQDVMCSATTSEISSRKRKTANCFLRRGFKWETSDLRRRWWLFFSLWPLFCMQHCFENFFLECVYTKIQISASFSSLKTYGFVFGRRRVRSSVGLFTRQPGKKGGMTWIFLSFWERTRSTSTFDTSAIWFLVNIRFWKRKNVVT